MNGDRVAHAVVGGAGEGRVGFAISSLICDRWSSCMQSPGALDSATVIFPALAPSPAREDAICARRRPHRFSSIRTRSVPERSTRNLGTAHRQRANVPYAMVLLLEIREVIVGVAAVGAFGAEVSAGRGGQD